MKKKIIIIGSGIAGLTLANFFKCCSEYEYVIYEKEDSLNLNEGYGIQLSVNSVSIINKLGFNKLMNIGLIGLGSMGYNLAKNLISKDFTVHALKKTIRLLKKLHLRK